MTFYEFTVYSKNYYKKDKESWEQARFNGYITAQVNSTKKLKITDIMKFPWDEEIKYGADVSNEDKERLQKLADNYLKTKINKEDA